MLNVLIGLMQLIGKKKLKQTTQHKTYAHLSSKEHSYKYKHTHVTSFLSPKGACYTNIVLRLEANWLCKYIIYLCACQVFKDIFTQTHMFC